MSFNSKNKYDNPNLPCYLNREYLERFKLWEYSDIIYKGKSAWVTPFGEINEIICNEIIPRFSQEPVEEYHKRIRKTPFLRRYGEILEGFTSLLSQFNITGKTIDNLKNADNIDGESNDLIGFLRKADTITLKKGFCFIMLGYRFDYDPTEGINVVDYRVTEETPLVYHLIDPSDVPNYKFNSRTKELEEITIEMDVEIPDGLWGEKTEKRWMTIDKNEWVVYRIEEDKAGDFLAVVESSGDLNLEKLPIIIYTATSESFETITPPFLNLADMNIAHYQVNSDYLSILHTCNVPVIVRKGFIESLVGQVSDQIPPIIVGSNSAIDISADGDFFYAEPKGTALAETRQALEDMLDLIDQEGIKFVSGNTAITAKEVELRAKRTELSLRNFALKKQHIIQELLDLRLLYVDEEIDAKIKVNNKIVKEELTADQIALLHQVGVISRKSCIVWLKNYELIDDVEAEEKQIDDEIVNIPLPPVQSTANGNPAGKPGGSPVVGVKMNNQFKTGSEGMAKPPNNDANR